MRVGWTCWSKWLLGGVGVLMMIRILRDRKRYWEFKKIGLSGPYSYPIVGRIVDIFSMGIFEVFKKWDKDYGKMYGVYFNHTGTGWVVIRDLDLMRDVLIKQFAYFPNRQFDSARMGKPWDEVLLNLRNDHWKHVRNQLSPTFSTGKIKKMMPAIQKVCESLQDAVGKSAQSGEMVELKLLSGKFSMDVIAAVAFGIDVDSLHNPDEPFVKQALAFEKPPRGFFPVLFVIFPFLGWILSKLGFEVGVFHTESQNFFLKLAEAALNERQEDQAKLHHDFLQLLIEAEKESESQKEVDKEIDHKDQLATSEQWTRKGLTRSEMLANAMLFILAGYGTVSTTISFTLFCLANHEDCLKKAQAEVDEKLGKEPVDYEKANDLTYLEMCISETLRLYPPGFILNREVEADVELAGITLKKGMSVMIPAFIMHQDPELWPQPEKFDPERFTAEARAARHPFAFMPFGHGPRNCIGMRLAQLELRMAVAAVLQKFTPVPCEKTVYPPKLHKMRMIAPDGLWVRFKPRDL